MSETILTAENLKFRYDSEQPVYALDGVSTSVKRGEFVAVLGANGCGKSTLAKQFNAILLPEAGTVLVVGMDTADESKIYDIRQTVGMVFQNPDNQIVATVVEEDVAFALENLGVPPEEMRRRVDDAMKMAGIYEFRERAPHNLSGGQKQRVAIAGVVAMRPDCLILDEATSALDPNTTQSILRLLKEINQTLGVTIVVITHEMRVIEQICKRVAVIDQSRIAEIGNVSDVFTHPKSDIAKALILPKSPTENLPPCTGKRLRLVARQVAAGSKQQQNVRRGGRNAGDFPRMHLEAVRPQLQRQQGTVLLRQLSVTRQEVHADGIVRTRAPNRAD